MGCQWEITIWDGLGLEKLDSLRLEIIKRSADFDQTFSRFKKTSLVWQLAGQVGEFSVPVDFTRMLIWYDKFYVATAGKFNPLIGWSLSDLGYDANYSLRPKAKIRPTPAWPETVKILDSTHIRLNAPALFDFGGLGKGYFADKLADFLESQGIERFLVNGSGDIFYRSHSESIRAGLEDPSDASRVLGVTELTAGALCASAANRRRWGNYHHIIDAQTLTSPTEIIASWVKAESTVVADGLATCLFLMPAEYLARHFKFAYCLLNADYKIKRSPDFVAEFY